MARPLLGSVRELAAETCAAVLLTFMGCESPPPSGPATLATKWLWLSNLENGPALAEQRR